MTKLEALFHGSMPKLVMFDLDGTLVDSIADLATGVDRMLEQLGRPAAGVDKVRCWVGNGTEVLVRRALADGGDISSLPAEAVDAAHSLFMAAYDKTNGEQSQLYAGVTETLEQLKLRHVPTAVVTNKPEHASHALLRQLGVEHYFPILVGGDTLAEKKPDPLPLNWVINYYGLAVDQVLMVGDSRSDVRAAKAAGCPVVAVSYGYNHGTPISEENPDLLVDSLSELFTE